MASGTRKTDKDIPALAVCSKLSRVIVLLPDACRPSCATRSTGRSTSWLSSRSLATALWCALRRCITTILSSSSTEIWRADSCTESRSRCAPRVHMWRQLTVIQRDIPVEVMANLVVACHLKSLRNLLMGDLWARNCIQTFRTQWPICVCAGTEH